MSEGNQIQFLSSIIILAILISGLLSRKRHANTPILKYALIWFAIIGSIIVIYGLTDGFDAVKNRLRLTIMPSEAVIEGQEIKIARSQDGHFYLNAKVNNASIRFLIDTGATFSVLSLDDAKSAGIDTASLKYIHKVNTASGTELFASTRIDIDINGYVLKQIPIMVNPSKSDVSVLGMSFLDSFNSVTLKGGNLVLE